MQRHIIELHTISAIDYVSRVFSVGQMGVRGEGQSSVVHAAQLGSWDRGWEWANRGSRRKTISVCFGIDLLFYCGDVGIGVGVGVGVGSLWSS